MAKFHTNGRETSMYAFEADLYCDDCALQIAARLDEEGIENNYDTDQYPQYVANDEADYPAHCASQSKCLNAINVDGRLIGCPLENNLTDEGIAYVRKIVEKPNAYERELAELWCAIYKDVLDI